MALSLATGPALAASTPKPAPTPVNTSAPTLTGTPAVGQVLTCAPGGWTGVANGYAYQWLRNGSPIAGQSASTYTVQSADQGTSISCQVTASALAGQYTIAGLESGSYKVSFEPESSGGDYLLQYFDGKLAEGEASLVSVAAPGATAGVDALLATGGEIAGRVTDEAGAGLANLSVCAEASGSGNCAVTNADGEYTVGGLAAGGYKVFFSGEECEANGCYEGYASQYYDDKGSEVGAAAVAVTPPSTTPNIDAVLHEAAVGAISGTVENEADEGLADVDVCAYGSGIPMCAPTNESGKYELQHLASGSHTVEFKTSAQTGDYITDYYHDKSTEAGAEHVTVATGTTTPLEEQVLEEGAEIEGKVTGKSSGAPVGDAEVCATEDATAKGVLYTCTFTNAGGEYALVGLPSGSEWVVTVFGFGTDYITANAAPVAVTAPATETVDVQLEESGRISGRVTSVAGAALADVEVCADAPGETECASTNDNGEYTVTALPSGAYEVEFSDAQCSPEGCGGEYLSARYSGDVTVTAPSDATNIDATLAEGARITGTVNAAGGAPVAGVSVCAENAEKAFERCVETDAAGGSASAISKALPVPAAPAPTPKLVFRLLGKPRFDAKTGDLDLSFEVSAPGSLRWALSFKNADVAFTDSVRMGAGASLGAEADSEEALALAAKTHGKKEQRKRAKKCKRGFVRHKGRCLPATVAFGRGSKSVAAGIVKVAVHASKKALKGLKARHTLHISGTFAYTASSGGAPIELAVKAVAHPAKKKKHKHKKHARRRKHKR